MPPVSTASAAVALTGGQDVVSLAAQRNCRGCGQVLLDNDDVRLQLPGLRGDDWLLRLEGQYEGRRMLLNVTRADIQCRLTAPGSHVDMLGLYIAEGTQHLDHETLQDHIAPHASSNLLFKGALNDETRSVFRGLIRVHPGAQRTDAYQTNRNLILSEDAHADSLPNLEIEADDVRCSHGATIGQQDEAQTFYLMSRGLTRAQAEKLIVSGFFEEVLSRVDVEPLHRRLSGVVEEKLGA